MENQKEVSVPLAWLEGLRERRDVVKHDLKKRYFKAELHLLIGYLDSLDHIIPKP